jgi:hypothetical protein
VLLDFIGLSNRKNQVLSAQIRLACVGHRSDESKDRNRGRRFAMSTFVIDAENSITALDGPEQAQGGEVFHSEQELLDLATAWPAARLVEVSNGIPGLTPVKKFRDRSTAISRIWNAIQSLNGATREPEAKPAAQTAGRGKKSHEPKASRRKATKPAAGRKLKKSPAREGSKKEYVLALLRQKGGATLSEIMKTTGLRLARALGPFRRFNLAHPKLLILRGGGLPSPLYRSSRRSGGNVVIA